MSSNRLIPRLLARRDRLGRVEKDAIFAAVLADVAPKRRARFWLAIAVPALAAAVALFVLVPWHHEDEFTARGSSRPVAAFRATCNGACTRGGKLVFDLYGTTSYRYFAAFAKRGDGTVLWYFPVPGGTSIDIAAATHGVLDQGIVLGDEHMPGSYRVYGVFSNAPLTREQVRAVFDDGAHERTEVVTADLEVR